MSGETQNAASWKQHVAAILVAIAMAGGGYYLPQIATIVCGEDPWGWPLGMIMPFLCSLGACAGFGLGLLFGYAVAEHFFEPPKHLK